MSKTKTVFLLLLATLFLTVFSQEDPDCSSTGFEGYADIVDPDGPSHVLYVINCASPNCYYNDMMGRAGPQLDSIILNDYAGTGSTIRRVKLTPEGFFEHDGSALKTKLEWNKYTQVWFGDLSSAADNTPAQISGYNDIINWYKNRGNPHIICDGRYLSSMWISGIAKNHWNVNHRPSRQLLKNYFANLRVRGGGIVLATDHAPDFTRGINTINAGIGIHPFTNFYHQEPHLMEVDTESSIWTYPAIGYLTHSQLEEGKTKKVSEYFTEKPIHEYGFIIDDSSTSDAPFNEQPSNRVLYPVSWHSGFLNTRPGVSSTIPGKVGFLIAIKSPKCDDHFEQEDMIHFEVEILKKGSDDEEQITFQWISNVDNVISAELKTTTFSIPAKELSRGEHVIICKARDYSYEKPLIAEARVRIRLVFLSGDDICFSAGWNGGKFPQEIFPIKKKPTAVDFYSYDEKNDHSKTGLEVPSSGQFYLYENDDNTLSLIANFGMYEESEEGSSSRAVADISIPALAGNHNVGIQLRDSKFDGYSWDSNDGTATLVFEFTATTAGVVIGPIPKKPFCVYISLKKRDENNIHNYYVRSHSTPNEEDKPNPSKIIYFSTAGLSTRDITLCYGQCRCPDTNLGALSDTFNNRGIDFANPDGVLGHYTEIDNCVWRIEPDTEDEVWGISIYFDEVGIESGDKLEIFDGSNTTSYEGTDSIAPFHSDESSLTVSFTPNGDGVSAIGFSATYWVLPSLFSIDPIRVPSAEETIITFKGSNFVDSPSLSCQIDGEIQETTFIDKNTILCKAPPHSIGIVNVEVTNDGKRFTITDGSGKHGDVHLEYFDASCEELKTCGACVAKDNCKWCNNGTKEGSFCFSGTGQCNAPAVEETCCTSCFELDSCSGGGTCECDNTCTCDEDRFDDPKNCSCLKCPVHPNGEYCGGPGIGECLCDGTCSCDDRFEGPDCSCTSCKGYNGLTCGGVGKCECDGNCTCDDGYRSLTDKYQICECPDFCPTAIVGEECSGHGECICGTCDCDDGWTLLPDCSCASQCTDDCNGNGICNCDGSCTCNVGFDGEFCDIKLNCSALDCNECLSDIERGCSWCTLDEVCLHPSEVSTYQTASACDRSELLVAGGSCPSLIVQEVPPTDYTVTIIVIVAGAVAALLLAIIAGIIISQSKSNSDLLKFGTDPFAEGGGAMTSGLYQSNTQTGESALYQSRNT